MIESGDCSCGMKQDVLSGNRDPDLIRNLTQIVSNRTQAQWGKATGFAPASVWRRQPALNRWITVSKETRSHLNYCIY